MIETIKANGAERGWFSRWAGLQASHNIQAEEDATIAFFLDPIPEFITELLPLSVRENIVPAIDDRMFIACLVNDGTYSEKIKDFSKGCTYLSCI